MGSIFGGNTPEKIARQHWEKYKNQFELTQGKLWRERGTSPTGSISHEDGLITIGGGTTKENVLRLAALTGAISGTSVATVDPNWAKSSRSGEAFESIYTLFALSVGSVFQQMVFGDAKQTSLLVDILLIPMLGRLPSEDKLFKELSHISASATGPNDRAWVCWKHCAVILDVNVLGVLGGHIALSMRQVQCMQGSEMLARQWR